MKNFLLIILSLSLMLSLCACSGAAAPTASPAETAEAERAAASAEASPAASEAAQSDAGKYVSVQYDMSGEYTDGVGNVYNYSFAIPRFDISGSAAETANQEIYDLLMPLIEEAQELMGGGYSLLVSDISYAAYLNGSIVSLVVSVDYDGAYTDCYIRNMDAESKAAADDEALFAYTGMGADGTTITDVTAACVGEYYSERYKDLTNSSVREQYDKTLSSDNLAEARYYLGEGGTLYAIVRIYAVAGAEYYYETVPLHR